MAHIARPRRFHSIVSGGQTGVDRAALDWAIDLGIDHHGWCPAGRRAEDGPIPAIYQLVETPSRNYSARTRLNVEGSDATLILASGALTGGTLETFRIATRLGKPLHVADLSAAAISKSLRDTQTWLDGTPIRTLNVAGPRESTSPGIYSLARKFLDSLA